MRWWVVAAAVALGLAASPAFADVEQFHAPSGNVHCGYYSDETITALRCDIRETNGPAPAAPADCELDWGNAFEMAVESQHAARICHGDTVADDNSPVLDYGDTWERDGFTCKSETTGMSCRNAEGAGWDLSRTRQKLY
ncbi:MAG: DUF6636 domain-containing protein [Rhizobiaceae bacterium]